MGLIVLIVSLKGVGFAHDLTLDRMLDVIHDLDDDGLIHLIAGNKADKRLSQISFHNVFLLP